MNQGSYQLSRAIPFEHRSHIAYGSNEEKYFFNVNYPRDLDKLVSSG
jgi:molybdenum cofactor guanylyltransferase